MHVSTVEGWEELVGDLSWEQLRQIAPLFNVLGAALEFGLMGSDEILGGCLATVKIPEGYGKAFVLPADDQPTKH